MVWLVEVSGAVSVGHVSEKVDLLPSQVSVKLDSLVAMY